MHRGVRRILLFQIALAAAAAVVMIGVRPEALPPALAAGYGGAMAMINTLLLARRTRRVGANATPVQLQTMGLMLGVIERFLFTLVAFAAGMGAFGLDPLALLVGFAGAQLGSVVAGVHAQATAAAGPGKRPLKQRS